MDSPSFKLEKEEGKKASMRALQKLIKKQETLDEWLGCAPWRTKTKFARKNFLDKLQPVSFLIQFSFLFPLMRENFYLMAETALFIFSKEKDFMR